MIGTSGQRRERWLLDLWSRRKWLAIVVFATTLIAGFTVARYVPSIYQATATVLVEEPQVEATAAGRMDRRLQLITQEIQSRARLEKLIQTYDLYPHLRREYSADVTVARMRRDIRTEFKAPPVAGGPASTLAFTITYRAPKPDTAARVANALAAFYLEEEAKIRGRKSTEAVQVLKEQIEEVSRTLQEQRQKLGSYADGSPAELSQQTAVELAALGRVHADLRSTTDERLRVLERRNDLLRSLAEAESSGPGATVEPVTKLARLNAELADLRRRFSDKYPDVMRLQAEIAVLEAQGESARPIPTPVTPPAPTAATVRLKESLADVDAQIAKLQADGDGLRAEIGAYAQRLDAAPRLRQAQEEISRDYRATRDTYDSLRRRYEQAQLEDRTEGSGSEPRFRILDAAVTPTIAAGPNRLLLFGLALVAAVTLSGGAVALSEQLDTSFHDADDIAAFAPVPVLASIPRIITANDLRARRKRFCLAALTVLVGMALMTQSLRSLARVEGGLIATLARGRS